MNFKKLMVSGIAMGAITLSSINLSYADTDLNILNNEEDSTVAVNQIENNSILNITSENETEGTEVSTVSELAVKIDTAVKTVTNEDIDEGILNFRNTIKSICSVVVSTNSNVQYASATTQPTEATKPVEEVTETEVPVTVEETETTKPVEEVTETEVPATVEETEATKPVEEVTEVATETTKEIEKATEPTKPVEPATEAPAKTYTKWAAHAVNVRTDAKTSSASLGVVAKGTKLTGTMVDGWLKVDYNGKVGYIYSSNLSDAEVKAPVKETENKKPEENQNNQTNNDKEFAYSKVLTVKATAYSMNEPGLSHMTASGIDLRQNPNVIAVDRSVIPLGTKVYVEGYGYAIAGDTGGAIKGNKIDVHFNSVDKCYQWGVKNNVKVYILK